MNARTDPSILAVPELCFATVPSGICVPYVVSGSGAPLVFVHGSLCDYRYWSGQTDFLSKHFLCVSVSLSHYWPASDACIQGEFGWKTHVAELAEFIAAMNLGPVHLVGHSRGGCVAFHVAREYPRLVKTLTLADPGGPLQIDRAPEAALPPATNVLRAKVADLIESGAIDAGLELFVDSVSMPGFWRKSPASFRTMAIDNAVTLPKQFRDPLPAYSHDAARDVKCRTLLIEGEKSPRMFRNNVEKLADWIDYADKQTIAGASHGMNVAKPAVFNRLVHAFVSA
ncbi:alpha/beta fold hydrolase [Paraburkholderia terricola]|jgi:pimeloyl-ACP methyl ester carboxylesterase|uniref:Pimeloyl-ACP methyl ester carboxylesterase n=1 Tax=Paraburkholderia terricola TaxID=169427 RepID=A0A1M6P1G1_9BURK|nr:MULTISPECIES: alpha/beta hydrolase [Paraburkholderia]AXE95635.1 alpha/beta hydrolase [Paraburkholderia terricola]ORC51871.1 alpha/beta hydrolase [Burkholderia sp. A27]SDO22108.1 Pimeloyl-ACP methyl ester carboxylesterase [Paraburkholderia sediminicola]SHK01766.1 Pimeloyl-ACP methyl ester carboxylesterase [Paraburkholderia terricola]